MPNSREFDSLPPMTARKRDVSSGAGPDRSPSLSGGAGAKPVDEAENSALLGESAGSSASDGAANGMSFLQAYERQNVKIPAWAMAGIRRFRARFCRRMRFGNATFRFTMLFLTVLVVFSGYFSYDLPGITSEDLKSVMSLSNTQLGVLFSVYAFPNAFLPLLSGVYYNAFGVWRGVLMISTVIAFGIAVVSLGAYAQSYWLMVAGRAIYGLGGESVYVGVDVLATDWFKDSELGLAYGLIQSAGQAGSFAAFYGVPWLSNYTHGFIASYWAAVVLAAGSLAALFFAHGLEQTMILPDPLAQGTTPSLAGGKGSDEGAGISGGSGEGLPDHLPLVISAAAAHVTSSTEFASAATVASNAAQHSGRRPGGMMVACLTSPTATRFGFHHLAHLGWDFWAVLASIATYSGCFYTFLAFGNDWLQAKYGMHADESGQLVGLISVFSMVVSPLSGLILDKRGGRAFAAFLAMLGSCLAFTLMGFSSAPVTPCILLAGFCYAVLPSALYPMIADVVPEEAFAQVYAIINAAVNMLLMLSFYGAGALSEVSLSLAEGHGVGGGTEALVASVAASAPGHARMLRRMRERPGARSRFKSVASTDHVETSQPGRGKAPGGKAAAASKGPISGLAAVAAAAGAAAAAAKATGTGAHSEGLSHGGGSEGEGRADSYHYVFYIFIAYTLAGAVATGLLALRDYRAWRSDSSKRQEKKEVRGDALGGPARSGTE